MPVKPCNNCPWRELYLELTEEFTKIVTMLCHQVNSIEDRCKEETEGIINDAQQVIGRLLEMNEEDEMKKGTIAVDFDGVIHKYSKGWHDGSIYDDPIPGAAEALQNLMNEGYEIVIFTTRADDRMVGGNLQKSQYDEVVQYLDYHKIPYTRVHKGVGKPLCKLLIDDNALRFEGNWTKALEDALHILQ